ncbi:hypothetical protein SporoP37_15690 [Sporosarcina sp. P37]|uniref:hypothetical protein n=1 Tax=unclassified Sporosarcina TaxID=2647733 RepID=UPI000A17C961|nr:MULTISPECIES: hypothetical protein [unclassified Sporosarcina]ARK25970.1 hypothetical protein SporoP37_15690 [Sporosarcina sp. P37]PID19338.1 hypothetical protein CSV62_02210 [Sporosarcina sp. P35]
MAVDLLKPLEFTADIEDLKEASEIFLEFLEWTQEQGWSEADIYRVSKMALSLLELRSKV